MGGCSMSVRVRQLAVLAMILAVPALALAGSTSADKAEKVAQRMLGLDKAIQTGASQVDKTIASLNALTQPEGDLVAKFKTYSKNVDDLEKFAAKAKGNAESAAKTRDQYIAQWKASQEQIQNPSLKQASESRRAELEPKIEAIKTSLSSARESFGPFLQDLKDLRTFLGNQLDATGLAAAGELITKSNATGEKLKSDLSMGSAAVKDLASSIQPGGTTPPAKS